MKWISINDFLPGRLFLNKKSYVLKFRKSGQKTIYLIASWDGRDFSVEAPEGYYFYEWMELPE